MRQIRIRFIKALQKVFDRIIRATNEVARPVAVATEIRPRVVIGCNALLQKVTKGRDVLGNFLVVAVAIPDRIEKRIGTPIFKLANIREVRERVHPGCHTSGYLRRYQRVLKYLLGSLPLPAGLHEMLKRVDAGGSNIWIAPQIIFRIEQRFYAGTRHPKRGKRLAQPVRKNLNQLR